MIILGKIFEWLGFPAFVKPFRHYDGEIGQIIEIKTSPRYTILTVGNKDFYFIRETGKYDGFGAMSSESSQLITDCTVVDTH